MEEPLNDQDKKEFFTKKILAECKDFLDHKFELNRSNIQFMAVSILVAASLIHTASLTFIYLPAIVLYITNLTRLFMTVFCIFSFYTWLNLIFGHKIDLNDKKIFILFLIGIISEFCIQVFMFHVSTSEADLAIASTFLSNIRIVVIVSLFCTLISYYLNYSLTKENVIYILLISSTRFFGSVYLSDTIPSSICSYFIYLCALGGILFSFFIKNSLMINDNLNLCNIQISFTKKCHDNWNSLNCRLSNGVLKHASKRDEKCILLKNDTDSSNLENNVSDASFNENLLKSNRTRRKLSNSSLLNKRRTSLPTSIGQFKSDKENSRGSQSSLITEVERIVDCCLENSDTATIESYSKCMERIKIMINRPLNKLFDQKKQTLEAKLNKSLNTKLSSNKFSSEITGFKSEQYLNDLKKVNEINSLSVEEDCQESNHSKTKLRRSLPLPSQKRFLGYSTTTSATGLPIDLPPSRQRSISVVCCSNNYEKLLNNLLSANETSHDPKKQILTPKIIFDDDIITNSPDSSNQVKTSDYESGESPTNSDYNSDTDKLNLKDNQEIVSYHHSICSQKLEQIREEYNNGEKKNHANNSEMGNHKKSIDDELLWQTEDLKYLELLNYLHDWNFPIFKFYEKSNQNVISQMAYKIFDEVGLFKSFDIPITPFIRYFTALERGYIDLPYHNKIHAADVLHACYFLTTQAVPGLIQINDSVKITNDRIPLNPYQYSLKFSLSNSEVYGCTGANFTPLELLALYCAAAMHDYEHPGRNNQFLVSINSPLALLYNDRSVLENHHASSSWLLLKSNPKFNFLTGLDANEWKKFRFLILENILATDLSKHFSIIAEFNLKANINPKRTGILQKSIIPFDFDSGIDWTSESDRLLCSQMILKLADINAPLKDKELHVQWTHRIVQEFYQQGDEELSRGMTISPFMDRRKPQVAKLQENFIQNLVGTLCSAYTHSGLLPGVLIEESDSTDDSDAESSSNRKSYKQRPKIFYSVLLSNIKSNYDMWREIVRQEQLTNK
ncbi:cGMP-inhibited 3 -5 -cyclic phosphodiesterase A [Brachionus plicatilis]|uniref:Phosphodiesterase n=1 Tax=Brachionus plicatilis TaxID=10195 RepID=A0A3M7QXC6_BRAPC|nr:cGMP-inhibited 3 -5 -cyclic phosphodiesterase A [Brachionus plicatilis]